MCKHFRVVMKRFSANGGDFDQFIICAIQKLGPEVSVGIFLQLLVAKTFKRHVPIVNLLTVKYFAILLKLLALYFILIKNSKSFNDILYSSSKTIA